ncbi:MAG: helix-hairpin-helix domain-containing protein [Sphingobacteriaceae bacterium]
MYKSFKEFFAFSKKELNGLLVLFILLLLIAFAPIIYSQFNPPEVYDYSAFRKEIEEFRASAQEKKFYYKNFEPQNESYEEVASGEPFAFNPNGLAITEWKKLGLSDKQIKVIKNYESKGGKFYSKEDLKKIYSIKEDDYIRLEPFIQIPERVDRYKSDFKDDYPKKAKPALVIIDINTADSIELERLNGIGPAFASRIIKYRNRLGGFCRKEQLKEVYGLDSILYQKIENQITLSSTAVKQIPLNSATFEDLKRHPYLSFKQMNAIIQYRNQHGDYKSLNDLKSVAILNEAVLHKIAPYLSFNSQ